jgi:alpha-beta hydrolase superfamily lysophospholipase
MLQEMLRAAPSLLCRLRPAAMAAACAATLCQCAREIPVSHQFEEPRLGPKSFVSYDRESFGYRKWLAEGSGEPETIIIGIHGFCGAALDYENLGEHLLEKHRSQGLYAYEVRGQGNDPLRERRGDIGDPEDWFRDLDTFTGLVRKEHPGARIVWFGESMGALIAAHAWHRRPAGADAPCDALVLSSPIVRFRDDFPEWKKVVVRVIAYAVPRARLSLETLAGGQPVQMTHDTVHSEQAETNAWHIERHTLRLLVSLGDLVDGMPPIAGELTLPTLVVHGGKDFFSRPEDVEAFYDRIPAATDKKRLFYPESHHLLMYDKGREQVIGDIAAWLDRD